VGDWSRVIAFYSKMNKSLKEILALVKKDSWSTGKPLVPLIPGKSAAGLLTWVSEETAKVCRKEPWLIDALYLAPAFTFRSVLVHAVFSLPLVWS